MQHSTTITIAILVALSLPLAGCLGPDESTDPSGPGDGAQGPEGSANATAEGGASDDGLVASFTMSEETVRADLDVEFDASGSTVPGDEDDANETQVQFLWDFGDGGTAEGIIVSHTYATAGGFTVTLNVSASEDAYDNTTLELLVLPPPEADLNETWDGSFPVGAPVESGSWVDEHDFTIDFPQSDVAVTLAGSGTAAAMDLALLDADGEEVDSATGSGAEKEITLASLEAGSYTVQVHMTSGASGSYDLTATGTAGIPLGEDAAE